MKERGNNINTPWKEICDFEDGEFYGFAMISNERKKIQEEVRREIESKSYVIDTYGEETEQFKEAKKESGRKEK